MRKSSSFKVLMMSTLALAIAGCANQQGSGPQVRDLSDARQAVENSPQYTVKAGDTLYGIAWQHNLDYRQLATINNIEPPYQIRPGQTIALREGAPSTAVASNQSTNNASSGGGAVATGLNPQTASVANDEQELDWLLPDESAIRRNQRLTAERDAVGAAEQVAEPSVGNEPSASTPEPEVAAAEPEPSSEPAQQPAPQPEPEPQPVSKPEPQPEVASANQSASEDRSSRTYTPAETVAWQWPTDGNVVGEFGQGDSITAGIDITGEKGQPVKAAGPGIVVYAGSGVRGYGNLILLKHNDQFLSAYAHNDSLRVSENDVVEAGEVIATMGDSDAENVRLHFEVRRDGQPQDPLEFLPSR
ncbi:peptidoglycan DD-metalloendopeptidase family protein [Halomonas sp. SpR8]|uniref:peptidoglycan DD-metalloendopeptidase family protein n=1 Tax=Halomonas sp. SpR8 TaxID=3050463 RepID=UPI0027E44DD0|nr:peptidoglycan DD-metalloendopeptidase family protein [Halomonas sp. SpR8]MDQ7728787.1 peptidoglycan DD-metalloendopeptidase family protein [Halomonas sp. SpR8]